MYCRHSCSRRHSWKLRANLYTSMMSSTSSTWPVPKSSFRPGDHGQGVVAGTGPRAPSVEKWGRSH